jgi:hypothetical protein
MIILSSSPTAYTPDDWWLKLLGPQFIELCHPSRGESSLEKRESNVDHTYDLVEL